ncbi:MAG: dihydroorotate dehydrogenase B catalytic subunit [Candidatus Buchananbacteria bacterium RBG_13_39_9]|uniref:Dihydroorotate dehydrogenase n=1 Tax=Candidatus Buchananbacteria bacterium RBG_13_39_9 TaxID=1797531 RepID=A0A1G1XNQ0_9BACT|nr:MAG: dihydroorotate dehydrogenase B catalytic subunit [Candidatus Buchananbacteria bacterium RBG_13_39_9]
MNLFDLSVNIGGLKLKNPIMNASGCFDPEQMCRVQGMDLSRLGAIVTKGTTLESRIGNPQPRIKETASGMINFIGLENPGVEVLINDKLVFLSQFGVPIIVNVCGKQVDDYVCMAQRLDQVYCIAALELNISCPNVKDGGIIFGSQPRIAASVVQVVRRVTKLPLIVKLTPNVTDIVSIAKAVVDFGADAISMINTVRSVFDHKGKIVQGGLSGPAIKPIARCLINQVAQAVSVPIIGMGGITTLQDVFDFFMVGATAVAIGTANFKNPLVIMELIEQLEKYCVEYGLENIDQVKKKLRKGGKK